MAVTITYQFVNPIVVAKYLRAAHLDRFIVNHVLGRVVAPLIFFADSLFQEFSKPNKI